MHVYNRLDLHEPLLWACFPLCATSAPSVPIATAESAGVSQDEGTSGSVGVSIRSQDGGFNMKDIAVRLPDPEDYWGRSPMMMILSVQPSVSDA